MSDFRIGTVEELFTKVGMADALIHARNLELAYGALREKCAELELKLLNCEDESKSGFYRGLSEELQAKLDEAAKQEPVDALEIVETVLLKINGHLSDSKGMFPQVADEYRASMHAITDILGHVRFYKERKRKFYEPLYRLPPNLPAIIAQAKAEERERLALDMESIMAPEMAARIRKNF